MAVLSLRPGGSVRLPSAGLLIVDSSVWELISVSLVGGGPEQFSKIGTALGGVGFLAAPAGALVSADPSVPGPLLLTLSPDGLLQFLFQEESPVFLEALNQLISDWFDTLPPATVDTATLSIDDINSETQDTRDASYQLRVICDQTASYNTNSIAEVSSLNSTAAVATQLLLDVNASSTATWPIGSYPDLASWLGAVVFS